MYGNSLNWSLAVISVVGIIWEMSTPGRTDTEKESKASTTETATEPTAAPVVLSTEIAAPPPPSHRPPQPEPKRERFFPRIHRWLKIAEPWGIALALVAFAIDYNGRVEERTRGAWELLSLGGPGNSGKVAALEYLNSWGFIKRRESLTGIDLSQPEGKVGTYLRDIDLTGANLGYATLSDADLIRATLGYATLSDANLIGADLRYANLIGANLSDTTLSGATLGYATLSGAILIGADLSGANLIGANLSGADLGGTNLSGAMLIGADVIGADLRYANLIGADLGGADLSGANLRGVSLNGTALSGTNLSGANLLRTHLFGEVKNLVQKQLYGSCGDETTELPDGLTIPMCSEVDWYEEIHGKNTKKENAKE